MHRVRCQGIKIMFVRDSFKPFLRAVCCSNSAIKCLSYVHKHPVKTPKWFHSDYADCISSCSSKLFNKSWNRTLASFGNKNDNNDPLDISLVWGSIERDPDYEAFSQKVFRMKHMGHNVLVVQPYARHRKPPINGTNPNLRLSEAVALVQSIPNWTALSAIALPVNSFKTSTLFGRGNLGRIISILRGNEKISAVFVSIDILNIAQLADLQEHLGVPVYDRYTVVIQIFHNHASSKEAKLQVAMAEIPYLQQCLDGLPEGLEDRLGEEFALIGGSSKTSMDKRREMLKRREHKIKEELEKLSTHRQLRRAKRARDNLPSVAIVGYTNAGKTSLIQVLTNEIKIQPKNRLFATLDVSSHRSILPSGLDLVYIDTVGFMSDLPDNLIQSFKATLEDAMFADIILHIWDVSHPESVLQIQHVTKILSSLRIERRILSEMVVVGNKVDKMSEIERQDLKERLPHVVQISCQTGEGINLLENLIEKQLIKVTGRKNIRLKVRSGSPEHLWLLDNATVTKSNVHEDENFMLVDALMTEGEIGKFRRRFIVKQKEKVLFE